MEMADIEKSEVKEAEQESTMSRPTSSPELHGERAINTGEAVTELPRNNETDSDWTHYNIAMLKYHRNPQDQTCTWYRTVDIAAFVREEDEEAVQSDQ